MFNFLVIEPIIKSKFIRHF